MISNGDTDAGLARSAVGEDSAAAAPGANAGSGAPPRLEILKTLGDNTRYAIYLELARSPRPLVTAEIADMLGLHANTVRPHLERMRDLGLVEVTAAPTGAVGRPQHRYSLAPDSPSLGLEPPTFPLLTRTLLTAASIAGLDADDVVEAGREAGRESQDRAERRLTCADALEADLAGLGFDPARIDEADSSTIAFTHCPFRELAEVHPDLVCGIHRGMIEGFVAAYDDTEVEDFHSLTDRTPCQVELHTNG